MSQQINLFNPVFLKQKKYFSLLAMVQSLTLLVVGMMLFYAYAAHRVESLSRQYEEMAKRYAADQARLARYTEEFSPQKSVTLLEEDLRKAEAELAAQQAILQTLKSGVIGNTTGYAEYLRAFSRQVVSGLWLTGFDIAGDGVKMSMTGAVLRPELVPVYVRRLSQEQVMRGKSFASLRMQQPKADSKGVRYVEFSLRSAEPDEASK